MSINAPTPTTIRDMDEAVLWLVRIQHLCSAVSVDEATPNQIDAVLTAVAVKSEILIQWLAALDTPNA